MLQGAVYLYTIMASLQVMTFAYPLRNEYDIDTAQGFGQIGNTRK